MTLVYLTPTHIGGPRVPALLVLVSMALVLSGCDRLPFGYTDISEVVAAPAQYEGQRVKVRGEVADSLKLPLIEVRYYTLRQGDTAMAVRTATDVPAVGARVTVIGRVTNAAIIGGAGIGLHLVEERRW